MFKQMGAWILVALLSAHAHYSHVTLLLTRVYRIQQIRGWGEGFRSLTSLATAINGPTVYVRV